MYSSTLRILLASVLAVSLIPIACDRRAASDEPDTSSGTPQSFAGIPSDQSRRGWTERRRYYLEVTPKPNPIPFQDLFELHVRIWKTEQRSRGVEGAELDSMRARMPAHDHGMKTAPKVVSGDDPGAFRVRGMRFHMQGLGEDGRWVIRLVVDGPDGLDRGSFTVQCCRPD